MSLFSLNRKACGFVTFFTAMLAAEMSQAGLVVYTSEAAWLNAVNGVQVEDFSLSPQGKLAKGPTDIGLFDITLSGVNECPNPVVDCGESFVKIAKKDSNEVLKADIDDAAITSMEFSNFGSVTAFAGDWSSTYSGDGLTMTIAGVTVTFSEQGLLYKGTHKVNDITSFEFLGVVSDVAFTTVSFEAGGLVR